MRVLVVEDERNLAETLRRGLTGEGFVVEVVHDGVEALWMATENPFDVIVLVARLRALIRRGAPERPMVLTAGDLQLDPGRRRVSRAGVEISLTAREYGLLAVLIHHRGYARGRRRVDLPRTRRCCSGRELTSHDDPASWARPARCP